MNIWIIEDMEMIRIGLEKIILQKIHPSTVHSFKDSNAVLNPQILDLPDILILDLGLPDVTGLELLTSLRNKYQNAKILIFTIYDDANHLFDALRMGANGYIIKGRNNEEIIEGIMEVSQGGAPMSRSIAKKLIESFYSTPNGTVKSILTNREYEVLQLLTQGYLYKEMAQNLGLSISTIKNHLQNIYQKMHVQNRSEAIIKYLSNKDE